MLINKEFMQKLVVGLRSGKYLQGINNLRTYNSTLQCWQYCPLGVAADIYDPNIFNNSYCLLPYTMRIEIGISEDLQNEIIYWNDKEGMTFNQIANKLEEEYLH